jgi:glycine dehydrogenase
MITGDPANRVSGSSSFDAADTFVARHLGPRRSEIESMLAAVGAESLDQLIDDTIPSGIRMSRPTTLGPGKAERDVLADLRALGKQNRVRRSYIGLGYHNTVTPPVILRNILEGPGWYTQYTPYQAEISQGRLEALLNFQTMVIDLTGLEVANASLLDEATAAAEAMTLCRRAIARKRPDATTFFVSERCHPQTIAVVQTRAEPLGLTVVVGDHERYEFDDATYACLLQYPDTDGRVDDLSAFTERAHAADARMIVATDLLALTLLRPPGEFGADIAIGNSQRFGVPMGYGGPHAAFIACRDDLKRMLPGRIVGVSKDASGAPALRLALQTREQHIRRDKATSNICTAQVLLAIVSGMYAIYHGPDGLVRIAERVHALTRAVSNELERLGHSVAPGAYFDTLRVVTKNRDEILRRCDEAGINLRLYDDGSFGVSLDQSVTTADVRDLSRVFGGQGDVDFTVGSSGIEGVHRRTSAFLAHPVFHRYRSETEMLRYIHRLQGRDLSLTHSMIPLGSCTMKLNATVEMMPVTWRGFSVLHPFAPTEQAAGYRELFQRLESWLMEITGFAGVSLQPNSGAQGEYAGLLVIRGYHRHRGDHDRVVCLIPESAHGTNPASAVLAGMSVVVVKCDGAGNIDLDDLRAKAAEHADRLAACMVTYPSTHGVFEVTIREICEVVHAHGAQVYLDGANMNAMVGLTRPGDFGADVCHLNLHKTFCIPHGGGGPGMGPIACAEHLVPFLPGHPLVELGGPESVGPVSAAPWGSPSILTISYAYIALMGGEGLKQASQVAILNANYIAARVQDHFPVLYRGTSGRVAHECIIDLRGLKAATGVEVDDVAKRLMDYGFHAPTMSWPVIGTLMIEPTESESKDELDRFCDALIAIREEIAELEAGKTTLAESPLRHAPHTAIEVTADQWDRSYSRETAAFPAPWTREAKFWPPVKRVDNVGGDRNLVCACPPIEAYGGNP